MTWSLKLSLVAPLFYVQIAWALEPTCFAFYDRATTRELMGAGEVSIAYRVFEHPAPALGTIVVANGFTESMPKYAEVAYDLFRRGYSVVLYDHRGQGESQRLLSDRHRGHMDDFNNFVEDLKAVVDHVAKPLGSQKLFLLAHSMGGGVGARFLEVYPQDFQAAVLSAPMLALPLPEVLREPVRLFMHLISSIGMEQIYVRGPTQPESFTFEKNQVTHDRDRYEALQTRVARENKDSQLWGFTAGWLYQAMTGGAAARGDARLAVAPILLLQAGLDQFVAQDGQDDFCNKASACTRLQIPTARHEVLMETDSIRMSVLAEITNFYNAH